MKRIAFVASLLVLSACGSGSGTSPSTGGTSAGGTSAAAATHAAAADANPIDGAAFCAFLTKLAPRLTQDGSAPGATADFAIEFANWIDDHPTQKPRTASDLDDASQKTCAKTRTTAVTAMGATSFSDALS